METITQTAWNDMTTLPEYGEQVLVWIKYENHSDFQWTDSEMLEPEYWDEFSYIEPNSKKVWNMGSAKNFVILAWARVTPFS